jgi:integrase
VGVSVPYLRRLKSGRLEYRRAFPIELRAHLGRRELIVSLGAKSLSEFGALARYHAANEDYDRLVSTARRIATGSFDELDGPRAAWIVQTYEAAFLAADDAARVAGKADPECHDAADSGWTDILERGDVAHIRELFGDDAVALASQQGWVIDRSGEAFSALCLEMLRTTVRANRLRMERDEGHPVPTPVAPEPPPSARSALTRNAGASFDASVKREMKRPTFTGGASTKQSWNTALRYLREAHGELPPEAITRRHATELADLLALAPVKCAIERTQREWPLRKLIETHAGGHVQRLSWKTRATLMGALQAAWNQCQRSGGINDDLPNPFARPSLGKAPPPRKNDGLTRDEARAIFALPLFTVGERLRGGRGEAAFWLPILLLTTGARPEELAQALLSDVREDAEIGEWWLTIAAEEDHPHKHKRTLKTPSAERAIPLPNVLIELGFGDYVGWLRRRRDRALFPALRPKGQRGELFARFGDWWSGYLRANGVSLNGKRPAREFRPTWATIARECGVSREAQVYLMGHAPDASDMNARYGSREPLSREMHKLSFDGWGLEKVQRWQLPSR